MASRHDEALSTRQLTPEESSPFARASCGERALYIEELVSELEKLSVGSELEPLRDILRLARREARKQGLRAAG